LIATKKAVIESIEIDESKIEFKKSVETTLDNFNNRFHLHSFYNRSIYQLDSILVKYNGNNLYKYGITYENISRRRFLKTVSFPEGEKYSFNYNHTNYPTTENIETKIDFYGFWVKNNTASSYGLMSRADYPSGGYSLFEYEKHEYSQEVEYSAPLMTKYLIESNNVYTDTLAGERNLPMPAEREDNEISDETISYTYYVTKYHHYGARIKKIRHYTAANIEVSSKEYIYQTTINGNTSSGILYQSRPVIGIHIVDGRKLYASGNIWQKNYNIEEPAVGYSTVFECNADNSYCKYSFTDWTDSPDNLTDVKMQFLPGQMPDDDWDNINLIFDGHSRIASRSDRRGKLKQTLTTTMIYCEALKQ